VVFQANWSIINTHSPSVLGFMSGPNQRPTLILSNQVIGLLLG